MFGLGNVTTSGLGPWVVCVVVGFGGGMGTVDGVFGVGGLDVGGETGGGSTTGPGAGTVGVVGVEGEVGVVGDCFGSTFTVLTAVALFPALSLME